MRFADARRSVRAYAAAMPRNQRLALVSTAVAVLVVGFIVARGGSGKDKTSTTRTPTTPTTDRTVVVGADGKPRGGVPTLRFPKGGVIRFRVRSAIADEIHFHGYDVIKDVPAGGTATFGVPARLDGRFVVELEGRGEQIASVEVTP